MQNIDKYQSKTWRKLGKILVISWLFIGYLLVIYWLSIGCTSIPQRLDPDLFYKRDMEIRVNGHQGEGVLVIPRASSYNFDIKAQGKLDLFTLTTCHREQTKEHAGDKGWFKNANHRKFEFIPAPLEADSLACPVQLGGYERIKGRHSWAFIDFEHPNLSLPAFLNCNGAQYNTKGVSVCQSKTGLLQEIRFTEQVLWPQENTCIKLMSNDEKKFRFKMPKGQCIFRFVTKSGEERWHRMTTIGYQQILIRKN